MPDKTLANNQPDSQGHASPDVAPLKSRRKLRRVTILLVIVGAIIAAVAAYHFRLPDRLSATHPKPSADEEPAPALGDLSPDNSLSSFQLLAELGRSPADPSRVLFPAFEKSVGQGGDKKSKSCPPGSVAPSALETFPGDSIQAQAEKAPLGSEGPPVLTGKTISTPVISTRGPGEAATQEKGRKKKRGAEPKAPDADKTGPTGALVTEDSPSRSEPESQDKGSEPRLAATPPAPTANSKTREPADRSRSDEFQLPGSLVVKIPNYAGTMAKWGLLVVLDDSETMARKSKQWQPSRMQVGVDFVGKLSDVMPPSSRVAIRDFMCSKTEGAKRQPAGPCPSHMLYDWTDMPFKGLRDKMQNLHPGGTTDPCAAAAYGLRKDLEGIKNAAPRLLIVTNGAGKCSAKELLQALSEKGGHEHTQVDVLALGMPKKRVPTFAAIARKGNGLLLKVDRPSEVEQALARYGKVLKTKAREKIEVRSDKAVFTSALEEEITLPPGSYTVTLPPVAGLEPSRRVIPNVKVSSGEAKVLDVPLKKGRPPTRAGKK